VLSLVVGVVLYMVAKKYVFGEDSERAEATRRAEKAMVRKAHTDLNSSSPFPFFFHLVAKNAITSFIGTACFIHVCVYVACWHASELRPTVSFPLTIQWNGKHIPTQVVARDSCI